MFNTIQLITYKIFSETIVASSLLDILVLFRTGSILLFCSFTLTSIHLRIAGTTFKSFPSLLVTSPITTTDEQMKIKFFYYVDCFFLSDHNFISNDGNLKIFLRSKDIAEWNKIIMKKIKKVKKNRVKNGSENLQLFIYALSEQRFYITRKNFKIDKMEITCLPPFF